MIAGGGTGGHIYPGIAVAEALEQLEPGIEVFFMGRSGSIEERVVTGEALSRGGEVGGHRAGGADHLIGERSVRRRHPRYQPHREAGSFDALTPGSVIGTSSIRRRACARQAARSIRQPARHGGADAGPHR